jgi:hypothetical protein
MDEGDVLGATELHTYSGKTLCILPQFLKSPNKTKNRRGKGGWQQACDG